MIQDTLSYLRQEIQSKFSDYKDVDFKLTSLTKLDAHFCPHIDEGTYSDTIIVAQTLDSVGSSYCYDEDPLLPDNILGQDTRKIQIGSRSIDIAVLDAAYGATKPKSNNCYHLEGNLLEKRSKRAEIVVSEVQKLIHDFGFDSPKLSMVGLVVPILSRLVDSGIQVSVTEFDESLVGGVYSGVKITHGSLTLKQISKSQIVLMTGSTLYTNTFEDILKIAKESNVRVIIYAETGAHFAEKFLKLGADRVISEEYPFYMFPGMSKIQVFGS